MDVPVPLQLRALLNMFSRFSCVEKYCNQQIMLLLVLKLACFTLGGGEKHNRKGSQ